MGRVGTIDKIVVTVVAASIVIWFVNRKISKQNHLPPTPRPIGDTHQAPHLPPWQTYSAWAKQYGNPITILSAATLSRLTAPSGDIIYLKAAGRESVVLSNPKAVSDLFDKRSAIYSERPVFHFAGSILGFDRGTALLQHNEIHKRTRRHLTQTMGPGAAKRYWGLQQYETARFLQRAINEPDTLSSQIKL